MSDAATGNAPGMNSALEAYRAAAQEQIAAMELVQETSDLLLRCIRRGDTSSLDGILDRRASACLAVSRAFARPLPELNVTQRGLSNKPAAVEIVQTRQRIERLKERVLTSQQECEAALRAALDDVRRQLRETSGRRKVTTAYQSPPAGPPRFLDHRQ